MQSKQINKKKCQCQKSGIGPNLCEFDGQHYCGCNRENPKACRAGEDPKKHECACQKHGCCRRTKDLPHFCSCCNKKRFQNYVCQGNMCEHKCYCLEDPLQCMRENKKHKCHHKDGVHSHLCKIDKDKHPCTCNTGTCIKHQQCMCQQGVRDKNCQTPRDQHICTCSFGACIKHQCSCKESKKDCKRHSANEEIDCCVICMEGDMVHGSFCHACGKFLHNQCMKIWTKIKGNICPYCKENFKQIDKK